MNILTGDPTPSFDARSDKNPRFSFDTVAGRNIVLTFISSGKEQADMLKKLAASRRFNDEHTALFIVTQNKDDEAEGALPLRIPGVRAFYDDDGNIAELYGLSRFEARPVSFIVSPRMQVIGLITAPTSEHAERVLEIVEEIPSVNELPPMLSHPPVMIIPHVFELELCKFLIKGYNDNGGQVSGFMRDVGGKTVEIQDKSHKVRRDWNIEEENSDLIGVIQNRFKRRVVPEIKKAYQFEVTRMERYIVSCYDSGEGGHFRAHRDNTTKGTAHRRFAISLNLNAEDYEGGDLRFPEFGTQTYRPPTGGVCIFSCSLQHEATPVTKGVRYAFLPFLYDEAARKIREENFKYLENEEDS